MEEGTVALNSRLILSRLDSEGYRTNISHSNFILQISINEKKVIEAIVRRMINWIRTIIL